MALGIAAGVYVAVLTARRKGFIDDDSYIAFAAVVGGIIGARALFVAENLGAAQRQPLECLPPEPSRGAESRSQNLLGFFLTRIGLRSLFGFFAATR